jgi:type III secretory pathway component EscV
MCHLIAYPFLDILTCAIKMNLQILFFHLVLLCDTCFFSQSIPAVSFPLLIVVTYLMRLWLNFINHARRPLLNKLVANCIEVIFMLDEYEKIKLHLT